jgi:hypothetical protein
MIIILIKKESKENEYIFDCDVIQLLENDESFFALFYGMESKKMKTDKKNRSSTFFYSFLHIILFFKDEHVNCMDVVYF